MIEAQIQIALDDDNRWWVQVRRADGLVSRHAYGNRKSLIDTFPHILAEVRGIPFPSIDMKPDEEITIGAPARRRGD